jgi:hypothetical protein
MPRKMRPSKGRLEAGFPLQSLSISDVLSIKCGLPHPNRLMPNDRIRDLDDLGEAWQQNRDVFLQICTCGVGRRCGDGHFYRTRHPGTRPWAYWYFDLDRDPGDIPLSDDAAQRAELERLGLIGDEERRELERIDRAEAEYHARLIGMRRSNGIS